MQEVKGITLIEGYHITATERKSIIQMLINGLICATNRPNTKRYTILKGTPEGENYTYKVEISTKATWNIGGNPEWRKEVITIKTK